MNLRKLFFLFLPICALVALISSAQAETESESFRYMTAEINSLSWLKTAVETAAPESPPSDRNLYDQMRDTNVSINQLNYAIGEIAKYENSTNEQINKTSRLLHGLYNRVIEISQKRVSMLEQVENMPPEKFMTSRGTMERRFSELTALYSTFWDDLFQAVCLSTWTLKDMHRELGGHTPYLLITTEEKEKLLKQLEDRFGEEIKADIETIDHKSISTPAMIRLFLTTTDLKNLKTSDS